MLLGELRRPGGHVEEQDCRSADQKPHPDIQNGLPAGALPVGRRHDDVVVRHFPVGKSVPELLVPLPLGLPLSVLFHRQKIACGVRIARVRPEHLLQVVLRLLPLLLLHIQKPQKQPCPHIVRVFRDDAGQLVHRRVPDTVPGQLQRPVVAADHVAVALQAAALPADVLQVVQGAVVLLIHIGADDPLDQGISHLAHLKVDESQEIPRVLMGLVQLECFFEKRKSPREFPLPGTDQGAVVAAVRRPAAALRDLLSLRP